MMASPAVLDTNRHFESLTLPHRNALYQAARSLTNNSAAAEDAVQEAYLQGWKSFHRFEPGTNVRAWMFAILFNVIRHERRKWTFRIHFPDTSEIFERTLRYEPPVPQELDDEEILAAIREIPQKYAEVLMMADVQEFAYKDIHQALHIPMGTVMSRLSRGRQLLRVKLAGRAAELGFKSAGLSAAVPQPERSRAAVL